MNARNLPSARLVEPAVSDYLPAATDLDDALANETHYGPRIRAIERALKAARSEAFREAVVACQQVADHSPMLHAQDGRVGARLCMAAIREKV